MTQTNDGRRSFSLTNLQLTAVYHLEHLLTASEVDLSHNIISRINSVFCLQSVERLNLSNNRLTSCRGLQLLPRLKYLDLRNNGR